MKRNFITGVVVGGLIFGSVGAFAGQYVATENPFPVQLNGNNVSIEGYNIEGSTYFKLRDIADTIGGFDVGFNDNTIQLSSGGFSYSSQSENDSSTFYDVVTTNEGTYNILKDTPSYTAHIYVSDNVELSVYEDTYGNQFISLSALDTIINKSGFFCSIFPTQKGIWEFKDWNNTTSHYEYVSEGDMFVDKKIKDFYILLSDYTEKIAPTVIPYVEKYYR